METWGRMVVARDWGWGYGAMLVKRYKLPVIRCVRSKVLMYSMVATVNNTKSYTWKLLRQLSLTCSHHNNKKSSYTCVEVSWAHLRLTQQLHVNYQYISIKLAGGGSGERKKQTITIIWFLKHSLHSEKKMEEGVNLYQGLRARSLWTK